MIDNQMLCINEIPTKIQMFDFLRQKKALNDAILDYWCGNNGQEWSDQEIISIVSELLGIELKMESNAYDFIKDYFNQQLMFEAIGYRTEDDYLNADGESLTETYVFFHDLKDRLLEITDEVKAYRYIKMRSSDGEWSFLLSDIAEIKEVEL
jgi:hypothetical protein